MSFYIRLVGSAALLIFSISGVFSGLNVLVFCIGAGLFLSCGLDAWWEWRDIKNQPSYKPSLFDEDEH